MIQYRTGGAQLLIPGVSVIQPMAESVVPWWLSGGVAGSKIVAAYQPKGAADLAASYINLANPGTNNAAPGVAPSFNAATGWTGNGSSTYLTTGITPTTAYTTIIRYSDATTVNGYLFGSYLTASIYLYGVYPVGTSLHGYWNGNANNIPAGTHPTGVLAIAGANCYKDGVADGTVPANHNTTLAMYIFGLNASGSASNFIAANILAMAIYNATLTADEVAAVTDAMEAL